MAVRYNLEGKAGTSEPFAITWKDAGAPVDVTGATVLMQMRADPEVAGDPDFSVSTEDVDGITVGGSNGVVTIPVNLAGMTPGQYQFDVIITLPAGDPTCLVYGTYDVLRLVSQP